MERKHVGLFEEKKCAGDKLVKHFDRNKDEIPDPFIDQQMDRKSSELGAVTAASAEKRGADLHTIDFLLMYCYSYLVSQRISGSPYGYTRSNLTQE